MEHVPVRIIPAISVIAALPLEQQIFYPVLLYIIPAGGESPLLSLIFMKETDILYMSESPGWENRKAGR